MRAESKQPVSIKFSDEEIAEIQERIGSVLRSGQLILGEETTALEKEFAQFVGTKHAIAVSSCSAALEIAYEIFTKQGEEIGVPVNTFAATLSSALRIGRQVQLLPIDRSFCLDFEKSLPKIPGLAAVVVVHLAGLIPDNMDALVDYCRVVGVPVIEDCAHAHGAEVWARQAGSFGDVGCFSFYPTKIMTCGVGGMLTTNNGLVDRVARTIRHHGAHQNKLDSIQRIGSDFLMDEMRAVIARVQLKKLPTVLAHRKAVAAAYDAVLPEEIRVKVPYGQRPSYYKYPVLFASAEGATIAAKALEAAGISVGKLYSPLPSEMPAFQSDNLFGSVMASVTTLEAHGLLARQLCLPMHADVAIEDCQEIADIIKGAIA